MLIWMLHLDQLVGLVTNRSIPAGGHDSTSRGMPPPLPARARPVRISNNYQGSYDQVQHQSYPESAAYRGAEGHGGYRDVGHHYDEDGEEEAVGEFQGEEEQGEGEYEESQEQEPEPEGEQEEYYHEPVEYEEQGYNARHHGGYGAGQMVEEGEDEDEDDEGDDDGYGY